MLGVVVIPHNQCTTSTSYLDPELDLTIGRDSSSNEDLTLLRFSRSRARGWGESLLHLTIATLLTTLFNLALQPWPKRQPYLAADLEADLDGDPNVGPRPNHTGQRGLRHSHGGAARQWQILHHE